jgi:hypothetical protein
LDCVPNQILIDAEVLVNQSVAHSDDFLPRNLGMGIPEWSGDQPAGFSDNLNVVHDPGLDEFVVVEGLTPACRVFLDTLDRLFDIG